MAIKVTKTSRVNPATNSSHDSLLLPLTFFDLRWIKFHPTEKVLFYKLHKHNSFHSLILPKLEHSLSTVLHHYLPLAGRLRWDPQDPKPHILVLPNDYATLIVAESDADFSLLSGKGIRPDTEIRSLVPELPASRDDSVFVLSLQVTLFPNQGFSIGVTAHHSAMDGRSMYMFVKSWAHVRKHGTIGELTPCLDRTVINVPASLDARILEVVSYFSEDKTSSRSLKLPPSGEISPDTVRITPELTQENVDKLKERAKNESTRSHLHLSTFVVANAYLWSCLVKTRGGDADRPVRFMYAADFRNRLGSPVPESYFGSCVLSVGCFGHKAGVVSGEDGFVNAVEIISDSVRGVGTLDVEALCELYIDGTMRVEPGTQTVSIVGSNRFGLYQSDFGWGKPVACETVSIDRNEAFSMSERRDESGGVEIGLCLKKCEMDLFIDLFQNVPFSKMLIANGVEIGSYTVILPHSYNNQNKTDTSLDNGGDLRRHLEKLVEAEKVQDFIKKNHFGQEAISEPSESWEFYREAIALCELYIDGTMTVKPGTQTVAIVGSNRFGLYGSDSEWGKPVGCETVFIDCDEGFSMSERRDEPGVVEIEAFV